MDRGWWVVGRSWMVVDGGGCWWMLVDGGGWCWIDSGSDRVDGGCANPYVRGFGSGCACAGGFEGGRGSVFGYGCVCSV